MMTESFALPTELHHLRKRTANISRYLNYRNTKCKNICLPVNTGYDGKGIWFFCVKLALHLKLAIFVKQTLHFNET
jgi:hypothetical protein